MIMMWPGLLLWAAASAPAELQVKAMEFKFAVARELGVLIWLPVLRAELATGLSGGPADHIPGVGPGR
jgi:hypothetical protein